MLYSPYHSDKFANSISMTKQRYLFAFVAILLAGLFMRVWFWNDQARAGWIEAGDEDEYYRGAIHLLLQGDYYDEGQWLRPPLTSAFFAGAFVLFGVNLPAALLLYAALSLLLPALVATLTLRNSHQRSSALVAGCASALFFPFATYASRLLSENLFLIFVSLALILLERVRTELRQNHAGYLPLLASGMVIGLATLTRPLLFYALPLLCLWLWWERRVRGIPVRAMLRLVFGAILIIAPWTARNYLVYHQFVLVDTTGGVDFWFGTTLTPDEKNLQAYWNETLPNAALRQQAAVAKGLDNIRRAPFTWVTRMRDKIYAVWQLETRSFVNNSAIGATFEKGALAYSLAADLEYIILMLAALVGIAGTRQEDVLLLGFPLYAIAISAVTSGMPRYRVPLMLVAIVYAAPVLANPRASVGELIRASRLRRILGATSLLLFLGMIASTSYLPFFQSQFSLTYAQFGGGETAFQHAIALTPSNVLPYLALGESRSTHGDAPGALAALDQAAQRQPKNTMVQAQRIALLRSLGKGVEANAAWREIAQTGWDNSQWYEWAWARVPFAPANEIDLPAPAVGAMHGVEATEQSDGTVYRWTLQRAEFRIARTGATRLFLRLRADERKNVDVFVDGVFVQTVAVSSPWNDFEIMLKKPAGTQTVVELRVPLTILNVNEPYPHGVAVAALAMK